MEKELKNAINDLITKHVDFCNRGMMSVYHISQKSLSTLCEYDIDSDFDHGLILKEGKPFIKVVYKFQIKAPHKMLKPTLIEL